MAPALTRRTTRRPSCRAHGEFDTPCAYLCETSGKPESRPADWGAGARQGTSRACCSPCRCATTSSRHAPPRGEQARRYEHTAGDRRAGGRGPTERRWPCRADALSGPTRQVDAENKYTNLKEYDVVIAFDADWISRSDEPGVDPASLKKWVEENGGALGGPIYTHRLARRPAVRSARSLCRCLRSCR